MPKRRSTKALLRLKKTWCRKAIYQAAEAIMLETTAISGKKFVSPLSLTGAMKNYAKRTYGGP